MKKMMIGVIALVIAGAAFAGGSKDQAPGGEVVYRRVYSGEVYSLNYLVSANAVDFKAFTNLVDALIEYDKYGITKPALAQSWEHNADYTVWTFKIRPGLKWVDHTGKAVADVSAADWVTAARYVNEAANASAIQYMYDGFIKNAGPYFRESGIRFAAEKSVESGEHKTLEEYYTAQGIDPSSLRLKPEDIGVRALDPLTLEYTMESPCIFFLSLLSYGSFLPVYGPFLESAGDRFGQGADTLLYNGPYILSSFKPQQERIEVRNPLYWDPGSVFIDRLESLYNAEATKLTPTMFTRGEVDYAEIGPDLVGQWLAGDTTKNLIRNSPPDKSYSYFYMFNFEPRFDAVYEPDNWLIAVNNENFRQSLFYGLDRLKALSVLDPNSPESLLNNTITPATFAVGAGKDFVQYPPIKPITDRDSFNSQEALAYKAKALPELRAAGAKFPIKILMPYNPIIVGWDKECQVVEQQLESLLGTDYIDIIVEAGPSTGFLAGVRRTGKYAFMKCNNGADYADPQTWITSFREIDNTYNFMSHDPAKMVDGKPSVNKPPATRQMTNQYYTLVNAAKAITTDEARRYNAFAEAEAFLINHAVIIPFSIDTYGYVASRLNPFEAQYAPYGLPPYRIKGMKLLERAMSNEEYKAAYAQWQREREAAIAVAAQ
ncbi:MAG: peptide ABC transporter substrate-binding protein [Spirochaetaceae bacterium]|jgi:oligopeptide transport system substrate-binding protein|nr:peptide ABC transporter substrate-binding protein [Spirochaetaceae bacterium]